MTGLQASATITWLLAAAFLKGVAGQRRTVFEVIANNSEFSLFAKTLSAASLDEDSILTDFSQILTVFVPNDSAVLADPTLGNYTENPGWAIHL